MKTIRLISYACLIVIVLHSCASVSVGPDFATETQKYNLEARAVQNDNKFTNSETGFHIGVSFDDIEVADKLEFQPEAKFISIKDLNQIQVPLLLSYEIVEDLAVQAGPNLGFLLDTSDFIKSFNFGADAGLSYNITDALAVEGRYNFGISNLLENGDSDNSVRLNILSFGLRYSLDFIGGGGN